MKYNEWHHGYTGIILVLLGFVGLWRGWTQLSIVLLFTTGVMMVIDDIMQHFVLGESPMHWIFVWLWKNTLGRIMKYPRGV